MFSHHRHGPGHTPTGEAGQAVYRVPIGLLGADGTWWITDQSGAEVFRASAQAAAGHGSLVLADETGKELFRIQDRSRQAEEFIAVQDAGAGVCAAVKTIASTASDRLIVELDNGAWFDVVGDVAGHEYELRQGGVALATVSPAGDAYVVGVSAGQNDPLILSITVGLDRITAG